jgi:cell division protein FtsB
MALLIGYFMFHALVGDRGLLNAHSRSKLLAARKLELAAAVRERQDLERQTQLMRIGSVSADLVEERARAMLGYSDRAIM